MGRVGLVARSVRPFFVTRWSGGRRVGPDSFEHLRYSSRNEVQRLTGIVETLEERVRSLEAENQALRQQLQTRQPFHDVLALPKIGIPGEATVSQKILGTGGFGTVYEGQLEGRVVAVKRQKIDEHTRTKIQREIDVLRHYEHKNICRYLYSKYEMIDGHWHLDIFMKKYDLDLAKLIRDETPTAEEKRKLLKEIVDGIQYLHSSHSKKEKIIHRDLKPENILIQRENNGYSCALSDFALSKITKSDDTIAKATSHTSYCGTLAYSAPETLSNSGGKFQKANEKSDIYSLGLVIYFVLTDGGHPFGNEWYKIPLEEPSLEAVMDSIFKQLLETMLKNDLTERISVEAITKHPAFFNEIEKLDYIEKCYDLLKNADENAILCMDYQFDELDWRDQICKHLRRQHLGHAKKGKIVDAYQRTFIDLVKAIRNKSAHFTEFCEKEIANAETPTVFSSSPLIKESFCKYWLDKFPQIIPILYSFLSISFPTSEKGNRNFLTELYGIREDLEIVQKFCFKSFSTQGIQRISEKETSAVVQNLLENKICVIGSSSTSFELKLKSSSNVTKEIVREKEKVSAFDFRCAENCQIAFGYESGLTCIYDFDGSYILHLKGTNGESSHTEKVLTIRWSPDGCLVASGGKDGRICVWDRKNGKYGFIKSTQINVEGYAKDIYWCSSRQFIISVGSFTIIQISVSLNANGDGASDLFSFKKVDLRSTEPHSICPVVDEFQNLSDKVDRTSLDISSGLLASLSQNGNIHVWSLSDQTNEPIIHLTLPPFQSCCTNSKSPKQGILWKSFPSSKIIYLASISNCSLRLWMFEDKDSFSPENILTFSAPDSSSPISAYSFSPCVRYFVFSHNFSVFIIFLKAADLQPIELFTSPERMRIDGFEWHTSSTKLYFWGKKGAFLIDLLAQATFFNAHINY